MLSQRSTIEARQARNNEETAGHWELYAAHRRRLGDAIVAELARAGGGRLCVLGAGNANDLDLPRLAQAAREVHLVDLDGRALRRARRRAGLRLTLHAPVDVGLNAPPRRWRSTPPTAEQRRALPAAMAAAVSAALPGPFDVVVSDCLLTQVYEGCFRALGRVPWLSDVLALALEVHLRVMLALGAGGRGLLATDAISSETHALEGFEADDGRERLLALGREGRLFTGTSPPTLLAALRAAGAGAPRVVAPWSWQQSRACALLVYAVGFEIPGDPMTRSG